MPIDPLTGEKTEDPTLEVTFDAEGAAEYMAILGIVDHPPHPETIRRWIREGRLKATKDSDRPGRGGQWRISLAEIAAFNPGRSGGRQGRPRKEPE